MKLEVPLVGGRGVVRGKGAKCGRWIGLGLLLAWAASLPAQGFVDPGFENDTVGSGGFIHPASGAWLYANDAGVVKPPAPNSSTGPLNTWSGTFPPVEGQQYASTYAGLDSLRQSVVFNSAGTYRISVYAAAPDGIVTIPSVGTFSLGNGEFTFTLANTAIGSLHPVLAGASWSPFAADFTVNSAGSYLLGIRNSSLSSPYFINYEAFSIQPIPEPSTLALGLLGLLGAGLIQRCCRRRAGQ